MERSCVNASVYTLDNHNLFVLLKPYKQTQTASAAVVNHSHGVIHMLLCRPNTDQLTTQRMRDERERRREVDILTNAVVSAASVGLRQSIKAEILFQKGSSRFVWHIFTWAQVYFKLRAAYIWII